MAGLLTSSATKTSRQGLGLRFARARLRWRLALAGLWPFRTSGATRFLFVPPHFHLSDPSIAGDIMAGQIVFAGRIMLAAGRSPFGLPAPGEGFAAALNGFQWLAHFDASDRREIREHARQMCRAFITGREAPPRDGMEPPATIARRVIAFVTHSEMLTEGADIHEYRLILRQLDRDIALLGVYARQKRLGMPRLEAAIAVLMHALATDLPARIANKAEARLMKAMGESILDDGATADRNAATVARIASDIVPLLALYRARKGNAPPFLGITLLRMVGFLRMMQHPDGALALFNGAGLAPRDLVAEATRFVSGRIPRRDSAPDAGFERLENEHGLLIADCGAAPARGFDQQAGAGALAFEFSTKTDRIIVNCGLPTGAEGELARIYRSAAAHSTVLIDDLGLGRIVERETMLGGKCPVLRTSPLALPPHRARSEAGETLTLGHGGLKTRLGFDISRQITLLDAGGIAGVDRLIRANPGRGAHRASIAFHLHPRVHPVRLSRGDAVVLRLPHQNPGRDLWLFEAPGQMIEVDESRCFDQEGVSGATSRILIERDIDATSEITWRLLPYRPET